MKRLAAKSVLPENAPTCTIRACAPFADAMQHNATAGAATWTRVLPREHAHTLSVPVRRIATFHGRSPRALIFSLPALRALRDGFPGAKLSAWTSPGLAPLLRESGIVDEVHLRPRGVSAHAALMARLHAHSCDVAVCFGRSRNAALLSWATGAPVRGGFSPSPMDALFSHRAHLEDEQEAQPRDFLELARAVGGRVENADARGLLAVSMQTLARADRVLEAAKLEGPFVLLAGERAPRETSERVNPRRRRDNTQVSSAQPNARDEAVESGHADGVAVRDAAFWSRLANEIASSWPVAVLHSVPTPARLNVAPKAASALENQAVVPLDGRFDWALLAGLCARSRGFVGPASGEIAPLAAILGVPCALWGQGALLPGENSRRVSSREETLAALGAQR